MSGVRCKLHHPHSPHHPINHIIMKTVLEQLIDELNGHIKYDDDIMPEAKAVLAIMVDKCKGKLAAEKIQLHDAFEDGYAQGYNSGYNEGQIDNQ